MAIEEPKYTVVQSDGSFSVRQYDRMIVAETEVEADFESAGNRAFRSLAGYIFGGNEGGKKIAMTAPVGMETGSEKRYKVHFTMPGEWTSSTLPRPEEPSVTLKVVEARKVAVLEYSGGWSEDRYRRHEVLLRKWMDDHGLRAKGPPVFARYNSPWTLWFLRRNEVLIPVEP
jgi:hypothetical protein